MLSLFPHLLNLRPTQDRPDKLKRMNQDQADALGEVAVGHLPLFLHGFRLLSGSHPHLGPRSRLHALQRPYAAHHNIRKLTAKNSSAYTVSNI
jgi:hypothetical protein